VLSGTLPTFTTGNESPLEQYINNTGLMWELAPEFQAQVIFMEHRYEGKSLPDPTINNCLSYSSSKQAIEDYARFLEQVLINSTIQTNNGNKDTGTIHRRPIIVFGGSYGGMLSAWFRMKYPQLVNGAIAASAPIWGLPRTNPTLIDGAYQVIKRGLQMPYPPTDSKKDTQNQPQNHCFTNLLVTWPLLQFLSKAVQESDTPITTTTADNNNAKKEMDPPGLSKLTEWFRLCKPLERVDELVDWALTPWFDMAEGSYPYASSYIPFSLIKSNGTILKLPAWPMQAACWNQSELHHDWGVRINGNLSNVAYNVSYGDSGLALSIDWDKMQSTNGSADLTRILASPQIQGLLISVRDAVAVWYNITKNEACFNLTPAVNLRKSAGMRGMLQPTAVGSQSLTGSSVGAPPLESNFQVDATEPTSKERRGLLLDDNDNATAQCEERIRDGSWGPLCCNEEMNLIITEATGMGRDMFWPPSYPRDTLTHADVIRHDAEQSNQTVPGFCSDDEGYFGFSQEPVDPWSTRLDTYYGGSRIEAFSNIVFSNGLLDPWMAGGVNVPPVPELNPTDPFAVPTYSGSIIRRIGSESQNMIALIIEFGGHHTDLMYSDKNDPPCVTRAREIEKSMIGKWITEAR
jgi:lysosomal Pro-X carboxypeptidase